MKKTVYAIGLLFGTTVIACGNVERKDVDHAGDTTAATNESADQREGTHTEKPSAPVVIEGQVGTSSATLKVGFLSDASDVVIEAWGVDGLAVTSSTMTVNGQPVSQSRFARGEYVQMNVSFTAPLAVRTNLGIRVRGVFGGKERERVQSFTVNADAPAVTKGPGEVRTGPDGVPVRVMRGE
jgi:hypothetical protein